MFPLLLYAHRFRRTTFLVRRHLVCTWEHLKTPENSFSATLLLRILFPGDNKVQNDQTRCSPYSYMYIGWGAHVHCPVSPHLVRNWEHLKSPENISGNGPYQFSAQAAWSPCLPKPYWQKEFCLRYCQLAGITKSCTIWIKMFQGVYKVQMDQTRFSPYSYMPIGLGEQHFRSVRSLSPPGNTWKLPIRYYMTKNNVPNSVYKVQMDQTRCYPHLDIPMAY